MKPNLSVSVCVCVCVLGAIYKLYENIQTSIICIVKLIEFHVNVSMCRVNLGRGVGGGTGHPGLAIAPLGLYLKP